MDADPVTSIDVIDEVFVAAQADVLRARLCDEARWERWFPGVQLCCVHDRGSLGKRWRLTGALVGTAEIWLEAVSMGTVVHAFLQADPPPPRRRRRTSARARHAPARILRTQVLAVKIDLDRDRRAWEPAAGFPRTPAADGRVSDDRRSSDVLERRQERPDGQPDDK